MIRVALGLCMLMATAAAAPVTQCKPGKGTPIFEARWQSGKATVVTKLFATGMWTRLARSPGHLPQNESGCFEAADIDTIKGALKVVKWKKTKAQEKCDGAEPNPIDFYASGVKRFTRKNCGGYELDVASTKVVDFIEHDIWLGFANPNMVDEPVDETVDF